jgi:hypothetical protein
MSTVAPSPASPVMIKDNNGTTLPSAEHPILTSSMPSLAVIIAALSTHLKSLAGAADRVTSSLSPTPQPHSSPTPLAWGVNEVPPMDSDDEPMSCLLSTMSSEEIAHLVHHPGTSFPLVRLCNTANASNTKTHWSAEEFHQIMGCQKFRNYKHLLQVSRDGKWVDGGEFLSSLDSYATIPKAKQGGLLNCTKYRCLEAVHMDIVFGDCVFVGGYHYALILVDRATWYNGTVDLKTLSSADIISAIRLFCAAAGLLACSFYSDCNLKLFGLAVSKYLIDGQSKVLATPEKHQSANGLVESHWKGMVHMACTYLTKKQMPVTFCFYLITDAARMMNAIPGKHSGRLASPFLLVHGVGHDEQTWVPLFLLA